MKVIRFVFLSCFFLFGCSIEVPENIKTGVSEEELRDMAQQLARDLIVIDTPPTALVTDALLISKHTHANIFVVRQNYTPKGILEIINNLQEKRIKSISLLVNDIRESKAFGYRYYYGYSYSYSYKYSYDYYREDSKKNG